ncbi:hypothetical protein BOX15_Mlig019091g1 [Macrostomum lignano]|uniref:non-specific serine/threonine protein kinase n=2 Tax=Macrostomum lignano TaxID=282301 RepID=A0A1I8H195_9PLAT|nr:hypothetical protein BOX15_Mlig019091g3 [Macrostomum lignano]PAA69350.1 hypothetical protein BOX15_Mlig019091g2 [Macrostomum lignano]PAA89890.1 hypothetical protein BOX15_Mlig019091g1 [Macrostomum lignano]
MLSPHTKRNLSRTSRQTRPGNRSTLVIQGRSNGSERKLHFLRVGNSDKSTIMAVRRTHEADEDFDIAALHNAEGAMSQEEIVDEILQAIYSDPRFKQKYALSSLFLIGAGAFGSVFRVVSNATGSAANPKYNEDYVKYLQKMKKSTKNTRGALMDSYRDEHCLDLVAVKFEPLTPEDVENNSVGKINLIREFYLLQELFGNQDNRYAMVGFPLPIDFSYVGNRRITKDLGKVIVYDPYGVQCSFKETYLEKFNIFGLREDDITDRTYFAMELLGPNLDDWKEFFAAKHSHEGRIFYSVQTTLKLMDQFLCRLLIMHRKNMVHLDLKPDNLCLGIGKMTNTVYLLDYGLSKICSENKPDITMGSRRYMSVAVLNLEPANYMMDIETWFYILIVLLTDYIPWSDEALSCQLGKNEKEGGAREEKLLQLVAQTKKQFWGDEGYWDKSLIQKVIDKIEGFHKVDVPDIGRIIMDIYEHIKRMRLDFYKLAYTRMNSEIRDEESDLFKRYKTLRKLLLYPYDCDFTGKGTCFAGDKDMQRRQEERRAKHSMLIYAEDGRNWHWDWDVWYAEDYLVEDASAHNSAGAGRRKAPPRPRHVSDRYAVSEVIDHGVLRVKPRN